MARVDYNVVVMSHALANALGSIEATGMTLIPVGGRAANRPSGMAGVATTPSLPCRFRRLACPHGKRVQGSAGPTTGLTNFTPKCFTTGAALTPATLTTHMNFLETGLLVGAKEWWFRREYTGCSLNWIKADAGCANRCASSIGREASFL